MSVVTIKIIPICDGFYFRIFRFWSCFYSYFGLNFGLMCSIPLQWKFNDYREWTHLFISIQLLPENIRIKLKWVKLINYIYISESKRFGVCNLHDIDFIQYFFFYIRNKNKFSDHFVNNAHCLVLTLWRNSLQKLVI